MISFGFSTELFPVLVTDVLRGHSSFFLYWPEWNGNSALQAILSSMLGKRRADQPGFDRSGYSPNPF